LMSSNNYSLQPNEYIDSWKENFDRGVFTNTGGLCM